MTGVERPISPTQRAEFKEYRGDVDIFVPRSQEAIYLAEHGIEIRRLSNGATLSGATRSVEDDSSVRIEMEFPSGAFHEPIGGINHVLEHLIANKPGKLSQRVEGGYNAVTAADLMEVQMWGYANLDVMDYGVLPIIPVALDKVLTHPQFTDEELRREKGVVLGELYEGIADPGKRFVNILYNTVFQEGIPDTYMTIGSEESINSITVEDVVEQHKKVFIPRDLDVRVFMEGDRKTTGILLDVFEERLGSVPDLGQKPQSVDKSLYGKLNPDFKQGAFYVADSGLRNGMVNIEYTWLLPVEPYTADSFALNRMFGVANEKMFAFFRESGLGYSSSPTTRDVGHDKLMFGFNLSVPKRPGMEKLAREYYPRLKEAVFGSFGEEDISHIDAITHQRLKAIPISVADRYRGVMSGLKDYNRIIDSERLSKIHQMITPELLKNNVEQVTSMDPTIFVIGDLSE
jgi:predicted Zn-dependent peptidase